MWQVDALDYFHAERVSCLFLHVSQIDMYSGYGFAFSVPLVLASTTVEFVECLIYWHGVLRGTCFTAKEVHEWVYDIRFSCHITFCCIQKLLVR